MTRADSIRQTASMVRWMSPWADAELMRGDHTTAGHVRQVAPSSLRGTASAAMKNGSHWCPSGSAKLLR